MRIMQIDTDCTDNGIGLRTTVYVSGCSQACKGCHNLYSWRVKNGTEMDIDAILDIIEQNPLADVTISGGDPLTFQYDETLHLLQEIRRCLDKNVWLYTGYTYEYLLKEKLEVLNYIDVLVDGRFVLSKKDLTLPFRGSSNQRIIDVETSMDLGVIQLLDLD